MVSRQAANTAGSRSYVETHRLKTSLPTETAYDVGSHASLPAIGDMHPDDANAYVQSIDVDNDSPWSGWLVTVTYTDERAYLQPNPNNEPETNEIHRDEIFITFASENYEVLVDEDRNGEGLVNSAGDPFYTLPTAQRTRLNINIAFNVTVIPTFLIDSLDKVNSAACTIGGLSFSARTLLYNNINVGQRLIRNDTIYYPVTYTLKHNRDTWDPQIVQAGFREKDGNGGLTPIKSPGGEPVDQPHPLDASGFALPNPITPSDYAYKKVEYYEQTSFTVFPGVS